MLARGSWMKLSKWSSAWLCCIKRETMKETKEERRTGMEMKLRRRNLLLRCCQNCVRIWTMQEVCIKNIWVDLFNIVCTSASLWMQSCCTLNVVCPPLIFHRPDGSRWTGTLCVSVSEPCSKWAEVACCRADCFMCPEHAAAADPLA